MTNEYKVIVRVRATGIMDAKEMEQGLQNISDELEGNTDFLKDLADKKTARNYGNKIRSLINNPLVKMLAAKI